MAAWLRAALLGLAAAASLATSAPRYPRRFPAWRVVTPAVVGAGCAPAHAWVSKSGKTGFGVSFALAAGDRERRCQVGISSATLRLGDRSLDVPGVSAIAVASGAARIYLPVAFDNEAAWNADEHHAELRVTFSVDGAASAPVVLRLVHEWPAPHEDRSRPIADQPTVSGGGTGAGAGTETDSGTGTGAGTGTGTGADTDTGAGTGMGTDTGTGAETE